MLAKITETHLAAVGAANVSEFSTSLDNFIAEHNRFKTMADNAPTLVTEARVNELISAAVKPLLTEARATDLITSTIATAIPAAMSAWAGSEGGKKLIGAEASKIVMEASAATGTTPAKPAPAPTVGSQSEQVENLEKAGKFEEAFALLPVKTKAEFMHDPKVYAAFKKRSGAVAIYNRESDFNSN